MFLFIRAHRLVALGGGVRRCGLPAEPRSPWSGSSTRSAGVTPWLPWMLLAADRLPRGARHSPRPRRGSRWSRRWCWPAATRTPARSPRCWAADTPSRRPRVRRDGRVAVPVVHRVRSRSARRLVAVQILPFLEYLSLEPRPRALRQAYALNPVRRADLDADRDDAGAELPRPPRQRQLRRAAQLPRTADYPGLAVWLLAAVGARLRRPRAGACGSSRRSACLPFLVIYAAPRHPPARVGVAACSTARPLTRFPASPASLADRRGLRARGVLVRRRAEDGGACSRVAARCRSRARGGRAPRTRQRGTFAS